MDALDARNKMSHTYDFQKFEEVIRAIQDDYLAIAENLCLKLLPEWTENA
jgi:hypothetical protein